MRLDINDLQQELNTIVCHLIYYTSKAFHLQHNPSIINHTTTHTVAFLINGFGDNLLKHSQLDKNSFKTKFSEIFHDNTINTLQSFTTTQPTNVSNANNPLNRYARTLSQPTASQDNPSRIQVNVNPATKFMDFLRQTLEGVLVVSIDNYNNQVDTNKATSQLAAFQTEILHEQATADTVNQMDFSPSVSPQELGELIAKSTSKAVSSLTREIQSLKSRLDNSTSNKRKSTPKSNNETSKNSPTRGRKGASSKKKSGNQNTSRSPSPTTKRRSRSKTKRNNYQGAKNRDTSKNRRKEPNKNNKMRSTKKRLSSHHN